MLLLALRAVLLVQGLPLKRGSRLVLKFGSGPWAAALDHGCGVTRGFGGAQPAGWPGERHPPGAAPLPEHEPQGTAVDLLRGESSSTR